MKQNGTPNAAAEAVRETLRRADAQAALVCALLDAMGGTLGLQPSLADIAAALRVSRTSLYRTLCVLEGRGVVVRHRVMEIHLEASPP